MRYYDFINENQNSKSWERVKQRIKEFKDNSNAFDQELDWVRILQSIHELKCIMKIIWDDKYEESVIERMQSNNDQKSCQKEIVEEDQNIK